MSRPFYNGEIAKAALNQKKNSHENADEPEPADGTNPTEPERFRYPYVDLPTQN